MRTRSRACWAAGRDYECVAEAIALAIEAGGDPIVTVDPACVAVAVTDQDATSDGVWALSPAAVEGHLKHNTAAIGRLPDVMAEDVDFGHYGFRLCLLHRDFRHRPRWIAAQRTG